MARTNCGLVFDTALAIPMPKRGGKTVRSSNLVTPTKMTPRQVVDLPHAVPRQIIADEGNTVSTSESTHASSRTRKNHRIPLPPPEQSRAPESPNRSERNGCVIGGDPVTRSVLASSCLADRRADKMVSHKQDGRLPQLDLAS